MWRRGFYGLITHDLVCQDRIMLIQVTGTDLFIEALSWETGQMTDFIPWTDICICYIDDRLTS